MKTRLIMVGKTTDKHIETLMNDYVGRLSHYVPFEILCLRSASEGKASRLDERAIKDAEGETILKNVTTADYVVLLDERGAERRSIEFAQWLEKKSVSSRRLTFIIGGAFGFSDAVYARADEQMSLSKMTFTHQMVRLFFVEQLYRACAINKGEKYHHE